MQKKVYRRISLLVICLLLLSSTLSFAQATGVELTNETQVRIAGIDRYSTAVEIAKTVFPDGVDTVIIARGDNLADGLVASLLAGEIKAPILLTRPNSVPKDTEDALKALGVKNAYLIGGNQAITDETEGSIEGLGVQTERVAGKNRFETAVAITEKAGTGNKTALIVNGASYSDALAVGPAAYSQGYPILLVQNDNIPQETKDALITYGIENIVIIGGTSVVSEVVATELSKLPGIQEIERVAGGDRFETSVEVAKRFFPDSDNIIIANGSDSSMVDAVGASALGKPIVFVNDREVRPQVQAYIEGKQSLTIIGGKKAVPEAIKEVLELSISKDSKEEKQESNDNQTGGGIPWVGGTITPDPVDREQEDRQPVNEIDIDGFARKENQFATARVTSPTAFEFAVGLEDIEVIEVLGDIILEEPIISNVIITIPEETNNLKLDLKGSTIGTLNVNGNGNTIENMTIGSLNIGEGVEDVELVNVRDQEGSVHNFSGGGGNSIKLRGNTTFEGNIRITSTSKEVHIRAEGDDAKINGIVSVESTRPTTVSAPVSNLVVNTPGATLTINSKVDRILARENVEITVGENGQTPKVEARIGTQVTAKDASGREIDNIEVSFILDTYELENNIYVATQLHNNTNEGDKHSNVPVGEKAKLQQAIIGAMAHNTELEATEENQKIIDDAAIELQEAIDEFRRNIIRIDRVELGNKIWEARNKKWAAIIGDSLGRYPQAAYDEFKEAIDEALTVFRTHEVTQEAINEQIEKLNAAMDAFNQARIKGTEEFEGRITLEFSGDIGNNQYYNSHWGHIRGKHKEHNGWDFIESNLEHNIDGNKLQLDYYFNDLDIYSEYVIALNINSYLLFLEISSDEIRDGIVKEIELKEDDFVIVDMSIENVESVKHQNLNIKFLNDDGTVITSTNWHAAEFYNADNPPKIKPGIYDIHYYIRTDNKGYYLLRNNVMVDNENKEITFSQDEIVNLDFMLNQGSENNYHFRSIGLRRAHDFITFHESFMDQQNIYLLKGEYSNIYLDLAIERNEIIHILNIHINSHDNPLVINENMQLEVSDKFNIVNTRRASTEEILTVNRNANLLWSLDMHLEIRNDLGQILNQIWNGEWYQGGQPYYLVEVITEDKTYKREIGQLWEIYELSLGDIIGDNTIEGQFTFKVSVPELNHLIGAFEQKMVLE